VQVDVTLTNSWAEHKGVYALLLWRSAAIKIWIKPHVLEHDVGLGVTSYLPAADRHHLASNQDPAIQTVREGVDACKVPPFL
jgi:hypothetical protein